jgi:hypothetical protein
MIRLSTLTPGRNGRNPETPEVTSGTQPGYVRDATSLTATGDGLRRLRPHRGAFKTSLSLSHIEYYIGSILRLG